MTRVGGIVIVMALIAAWVIFFWPGVLGELHWEESRAPKAGGVVHLPFDPCGRWRPDRLLLWASPCHGCPKKAEELAVARRDGLQPLGSGRSPDLSTAC